jgi:hydrogenase nickel incorporation protein HypB
MKIKILKNINNANDAIAVQNREVLDSNGILAINLMSSPGAGKTSLILKTIEHLMDKLRMAVIEGDIASRIDADKIAREGIPVVQINTGGDCSLHAHMIARALGGLQLSKIDVLIIENVGNLICPAPFALGEHRKVVIASIPEGDDKPMKYPVMFTEADAVIINKIDVMSHFDFDLPRFKKRLEGLNPKVEIFEVSCKRNEGIAAWCSWLSKQCKKQRG